MTKAWNPMCLVEIILKYYGRFVLFVWRYWFSSNGLLILFWARGQEMHFIMFIWYLWEKKPNTICACSRQEFKIKFYRTECQHLPFTHNYFFLRNRIPLNSFKIQTAKTSEGMWLFTNLTGLCLISYNFVMGHVFKRVSYWKDVQKEDV